MSVSEYALPLKGNHGLRRSLIVASLLADVFQGRLRAGQHLVTQDLADRFGVSHTPIREALIAMSAIGLIDLLPNRGAVVRRVTEREIREICQVRRVLECEAARQACGRIDPAELRRLAAELRRLAASPSDSGEFIAAARDLDSRLHDQITASCGNAFLANEIGRLQILFRALRDAAWEHDEAKNDYRRLGEETRQHLAIVEALAAGDRRAAARAMALHINSGARYWIRAVQDAVDGSRTPPPASRSRREEPTR